MCDRAVQAAIQHSVSCASRGWRVISDEQKTTRDLFNVCIPRIRLPWPGFAIPRHAGRAGRPAGAGARYLRRGLRALGYDLWALVQNGPEEHLNQTDKTQPAILTVSIALWRLWLAEGGARPAFVAGHSLGEYSALVAAESLAFADAVKLVERRGQLMQQAVPAGQGGMAAILGLEDADVLAACAEAAQGEVVSASTSTRRGR